MEHLSHKNLRKNLFDARGKESKQEWPNVKPKTERQPPATAADTNDIFKHYCPTKILKGRPF
jgi:hypothetical protein